MGAGGRQAEWLEKRSMRQLLTQVTTPALPAAKKFRQMTNSWRVDVEVTWREKQQMEV